MATLLKKTVKPSGGDYTTLQAAISANAKDLRAGTGSDEYLEIEIGGDWSGGPDTTAVVITGYETDATHYIRIYTDASNRAGTSWNTGKYRLQLDGTSLGVLQIAEDYVRIDGLQVFGSTDADTARVIMVGAATISASSDLRISNCLVRNEGNASYSEGGIVQQDGKMTIWNCVVYGSSSGTFSAGIYCSGETTTIYNTTVSGSKYGIWYNAGTVVLKNCYASGESGKCYSGAAGSTQTNCAASDTTAEDTDPHDSIACDADTFVNVGAGTENFALAADGLSPLKGHGLDITGDGEPFTTGCATDIVGATRDATWDIGAAAWVEAASQFARPSSDVAGGTFRSIVTTAPFGPRVIA